MNNHINDETVNLIDEEFEKLVTKPMSNQAAMALIDKLTNTLTKTDQLQAAFKLLMLDQVNAAIDLRDNLQSLKQREAA